LERKLGNVALLALASEIIEGNEQIAHRAEALGGAGYGVFNFLHLACAAGRRFKPGSILKSITNEPPVKRLPRFCQQFWSAQAFLQEAGARIPSGLTRTLRKKKRREIGLAALG
jgi:hypothetical protein